MVLAKSGCAEYLEVPRASGRLSRQDKERIGRSAGEPNPALSKARVGFTDMFQNQFWRRFSEGFRKQLILG